MDGARDRADAFEAATRRGRPPPSSGGVAEDAGGRMAEGHTGDPGPPTGPPPDPPPGPPPGPTRRRGLFGRLRHRQDDNEAEALRAWIERTQGRDAAQVAVLVSEVRAQAEVIGKQAESAAAEILERARGDGDDLVRAAREEARVQREAARVSAEQEAQARRKTEQHERKFVRDKELLIALKREVVVTEETALLQEAGIYAYRHPMEDSVAYRQALEDLRTRIRTTVTTGRAVRSATEWVVNNSKTKGRRLARDVSKLMLRSYNAEADYAVRVMRPHKVGSLTDRLARSRETIARLGALMEIEITDEYHELRVRELQLVADFQQKKDEEKERARELRARQREELAAQKAFEREREKLDKELNHNRAALERLRTLGDTAGAAEIEQRLEQIEAALLTVEERAANIRTGYVYVVSNLGAFGDRIVKIGMTRRLEPLERVYELSGAAVPFRYDVHALIFSEDAVGLEARLHREFADRRVNRVNSRKEFFYVTPVEVRDALAQFAGQHLVEFREDSEALEWRASRSDPDGG